MPDVPPPVFWVSFLTNVPFMAVQLCSGMGNAQRGVTTCTSKNVAATCDDGSNDHSKDVNHLRTPTLRDRAPHCKGTAAFDWLRTAAYVVSNNLWLDGDEDGLVDDEHAVFDVLPCRLGSLVVRLIGSVEAHEVLHTIRHIPLHTHYQPPLHHAHTYIVQ